MAREQTSVTKLARLAETKHNEDMVLAESSLLGERRVNVVRLAMFAMFGFGQQVLAPAAGAPPRPDGWRDLAVLGYALFAVGVLVKLRRIAPDPRKALILPLFTILLDFAFISFMAVRSWDLERLAFPEMGAAAYALMLCFSVARFSWIHVAASTLGACASYLLVSSYAGVLSPISTPFVIGAFLTLGLLIGLTSSAVRRTFTGLRARDNLTRFLPRQIADRILESGEISLQPVQREVTVLFSDIRDFTTLSETLPPRQVLQLLDNYFGQMSQIVKGHDGIVNKFLGDGMLAFWGVPDGNERHAEQALRAALDMRKKLVELNQARVAAGEPELRIGIGVHSGIVAAGMLGGADQHEYTVIGDAVNVASRVEGLTKALGIDVLVSESSWLLAGGGFQGDRVAEEKVKGRAAPVVVYSLLGRTGGPAHGVERRAGMDLETELKAARTAFDESAAGAATMPLASLARVLAAIGQPHELDGAMDVIDYVKRTSFDASPADRLAWTELQTWLQSDGRDRR